MFVAYRGISPIARPRVPTKEELEAKRIAQMAAYDTLPPALRQAFQECPWPLAVPRNTRGLDIVGLIARIKALQSEDEARELHYLLDR